MLFFVETADIDIAKHFETFGGCKIKFSSNVHHLLQSLLHEHSCFNLSIAGARTVLCSSPVMNLFSVDEVC